MSETAVASVRVPAAYAAEPSGDRAVCLPVEPPVAPERLFAGFLGERGASRRTSRARRLTCIVSVALHGAGLAFGAAHAFWQVEEISPPAVTVSFLTLPVAVPPPPPPPPKGTARAKTPRRSLTRQPVVVQPVIAPVAPEPPVEEAAPGDEQGSEAGVEGGEIGGVAGGVIGGSVSTAAPAPAPPKPPELPAAARRAILDRYLQEIFRSRISANHRYPPEAERLGVEGRVLIRVSIDRSGRLLGTQRLGACPDEILCEDGERTIRASAPFPPPPAELGGTVQVEVPFNYRLP